MTAPATVVTELATVLAETQNGPLNLANLGSFLQTAMELVEKDGRGYDKKDLAIRMVKTLMASNDTTSALTKDIVDSGALASMVDVIVAASKGHVNVNATVTAGTKSCFAFCKRIGIDYAKKRVAAWVTRH